MILIDDDNNKIEVFGLGSEVYVIVRIAVKRINRKPYHDLFLYHDGCKIATIHKSIIGNDKIDCITLPIKCFVDSFTYGGGSATFITYELFPVTANTTISCTQYEVMKTDTEALGYISNISPESIKYACNILDHT